MTTHLEKSFGQFIEAVEQQSLVTLYPSGEWEVQNGWLSRVRRFFGGENRQWVALAENFVVMLDQLEKNPIRFAVSSTQSVQQKVDFYHYLRAAHAIENRLLALNSEKAQQVLHRLQQRVAALSYRLESVNGGLDKTDVRSNAILKSLNKLANSWKQEQASFEQSCSMSLENQALQSVCRYPKFVSLLFTDTRLRDAFFDWVVRDHLAVDIFVEFPALQEKITKSSLQSRIGRLGGTALKLRKKTTLGEAGEEWQEKSVTLLMEGREVSLLDERLEVTFRGNYKLTVGQIFETFSRKFKEVGNLEFFSEGVTNWNTHKLGWWDEDRKEHKAIDITHEHWWKQLPHLETIGAKEAYERYGVFLDGVHWVVAAYATRGSRTLDFENTHAFFEIAIPKSQNEYQIFHFGKLGIYFPTNFIENISCLCEIMEATVAYPDENIFYTSRQHTLYPFALTAAQGQKLMKLIRDDIQKSRAGDFVYQIESENCAKWTHEKLVDVLGEERVPNLYRMSLLDTEPTGFVGKVFNFVKSLPRTIQAKALTRLHLPFGAWRGKWIFTKGQKIWVSVMSHEFWHTAEIYLPAMLHAQRESGVLALAFVGVSAAASWWHHTRAKPQPKLPTVAIPHTRKSFKSYWLSDFAWLQTSVQNFRSAARSFAGISYDRALWLLLQTGRQRLEEWCGGTFVAKFFNELPPGMFWSFKHTAAKLSYYY